MLTRLKQSLFLILALMISTAAFAENDPYKDMQVAADKIFSTMVHSSLVMRIKRQLIHNVRLISKLSKTI